MRYYWDVVSNLLMKFGFKEHIKRKPPLTMLDKKQKSLAEWI